jgi:hypothetical protein
MTFLDGYMGGTYYLYRVYMERDYITTLQLTFLDGWMDTYMDRWIHGRREEHTTYTGCTWNGITLQMTFLDGSIHGWIGT